MTAPAAQRIDEFVLTHRAGHKEYRLWLRRTNSGKRWLVGFAYGRIGSRLREGCKTRAPVSCLEATDIIERVLDEKMRKGYVLAMTPPREARAPAALNSGDTPLGRTSTAVPMYVVNREGRGCSISEARCSAPRRIRTFQEVATCRCTK